MDSAVPYTFCVLGAAALYLLVRPGARWLQVLGMFLGFGALAALVSSVALALGEPGSRPEIFFAIFGLIATASAVRMVTHSRPVFSALYFVMVVLSSAGLFLLLEAEFMAFALVIVYAGAILITYMFVLMLAQQASSPSDVTEQAEYDRFPREPAAAVTVGFVVLALLTTLIYEGVPTLSPRTTEGEAMAEAWAELEGMPIRLENAVRAIDPSATIISADDQRVFTEDGAGFVIVETPDTAGQARLDLPVDAMPENVQRIGWALVHKFPVSLELAGIILLMAMFGAVVLARKQIEAGEEDLRKAAARVTGSAGGGGSR